MTYILRFVQQYRPADREAFLDIEARFEELERSSPHLPRGRRYQPLSGASPNHSMVWECQFQSLGDVQTALRRLNDDPTHTRLFQQQSPFITEIHTEIFEVLEF